MQHTSFERDLLRRQGRRQGKQREDKPPNPGGFDESKAAKDLTARRTENNKGNNKPKLKQQSAWTCSAAKAAAKANNAKTSRRPRENSINQNPPRI
jgi:hypothetical protein